MDWNDPVQAGLLDPEEGEGRDQQEPKTLSILASWVSFMVAMDLAYTVPGESGQHL